MLLTRGLFNLSPKGMGRAKESHTRNKMLGFFKQQK